MEAYHVGRSVLNLNGEKLGAYISSISMNDSYYDSYECNETAGHAVWCICVAPH